MAFLVFIIFVVSMAFVSKTMSNREFGIFLSGIFMTLFYIVSMAAFLK